MNFKEFEEKYNPLVLNQQEGISKYYIPTTWPEARVILAYPTNCIWSIVEEEGKLYLKNDLHFQGKIANIATEKVWEGDRNTFKIEINV